MAFPFSRREREPDVEYISAPIPTALVERSNGKVELPDLDQRRLDTIEKAGIYAGEFRKELRELQIQLTENTLKLESARRENGELRLGIAQSQNDRQTLQAQIEAQRQEIADLRAILSNITLQLHHARIPLPPVWELLRQNQEAKHESPLGTIDRPASGTDQGTGSADPAA